MMLEVAGQQVECETIEGLSPTLVFLHEGLGSAKQWRAFPAEVAAATRRGAFSYSRLGYGDSDPVPLPRPLTYMEDEARDFLPRVLDAAKIRSAILIGHSDGASIALVHAALDRAKRVKGLVLEAPHVFVEDLSVASIEKARVAYQTQDLKEKLSKYHRHVDVAFRGWNDAWLHPDFRRWNLEHWLPSIAVPTLVIQGEGDPYGTRAQVDAVARQVKGPVQVELLADCGHAPHRDQPARTTELIKRFVLELVTSTRAGAAARE